MSILGYFEVFFTRVFTVDSVPKVCTILEARWPRFWGYCVKFVGYFEVWLFVLGHAAWLSGTMVIVDSVPCSLPLL